jgi:hypothetical protein
MSWLSFAYCVFAVIIAFFSGYYFLACLLMRREIIKLNQQLETAYELADFLHQLDQDDSVSPEA